MTQTVMGYPKRGTGAVTSGFLACFRFADGACPACSLFRTVIVSLFLSACIFLPRPLPAGQDDAPPAAASRTIESGQTGSGVKFGIWGAKSAAPVPTLFVLAATIKDTLGDPYYRQSGTFLAKEGYLCVSVDLPCHGLERRAGEPDGLDGWRFRAERDEDFVAETVSRLKRVLDHLIETGRTDAARVAACGTSRGGFMALHFAAGDERVKCVAAFAPVTDLDILREFDGLSRHPRTRSLALSHQAKNWRAGLSGSLSAIKTTASEPTTRLPLLAKSRWSRSKSTSPAKCTK